MIGRLTRGIALLAVIASCGGRQVDLGRNAGHETWGSDSGVGTTAVTLYEGSARVVDFAIDEERLYVLTDGLTDGATAKLRSCSLHACASTLRTLVEFPLGDPGQPVQLDELALSSGELFFSTSGDHPSVFACPTTGCDSGPRVVTSRGIAGPFVADERDLYFTTETSLWACSRSGCDSPHEVYRRSNDDTRLALGTFELGSRDPFIYIWNGTKDVVWRIDRGFTQKEEIVFESRYPTGGIAFGPDGLYVAVSILAGSVFRCESGGSCDATQGIVATGQRYPSRIIVNERNVDWVNATSGWSTATIVSCPREDCSRPRSIATADADSLVRYRDNTKVIVWAEHVSTDPWLDRMQMVSP